MLDMRFRAPIAMLLLLSLAACSPKREAVTRAPVQPAVVTDDRPLSIPRKTEYNQAVDLFKHKKYAQAEKQIARMLAARSLSDSDPGAFGVPGTVMDPVLPFHGPFFEGWRPLR